MTCGCSKRSTSKFKWTGSGVDSEGNPVVLTVLYDTEMQAKAKVLRKGGSYEPVGG